MKKVFAVIGVIFLLIVISVLAIPGQWFGTWFDNKVEFIDQKIDDATNYETIKKVEDTCRAMIASYEADKLTYEQYKASDNEEKQSWAEQAAMRANKTAATYNNYLLENSFVWADNIPADIRRSLDYVK